MRETVPSFLYSMAAAVFGRGGGGGIDLSSEEGMRLKKVEAMIVVVVVRERS